MGTEKIFKLLGIATALFCSVVSVECSAKGLLGVDSSSFYQSAEGRSSSSTSLSVGIDINPSSQVLTSEIEVHVYSFILKPDAFAFYVPDLYVATSRELLGPHQFSLGRKNVAWTELDEQWKMGLWASRFNWDPVHPSLVGMVGAFYEYNSGLVSVKVYASPLAVPEQGVPLVDEDGKLDSPSHGWVPLPKSVGVLNQDLNIKYTIDTPALNKILVRPNAGIQLGIGAERGPWTKVSYGYLPIHQTSIAFEGKIDPKNLNFDATIHPQFLQKHVVSGEVGLTQRKWNLWASFSREMPQNAAVPSEWIYNRLGPANIAALGGGIRPSKNFEFKTAYLYTKEDIGIPASAEFGLELPSRFYLQHAFRADFGFMMTSPVSYQAGTVIDVRNRSQLYSLDLNYKPRGSRWNINLGTDLFASTTESGTIGQFAQNDRVRGRVTYEF